MTKLEPYFLIKVKPSETPEGPPENLRMSPGQWKCLSQAGCSELRIQETFGGPRVHADFDMQSLAVGSHAPSLALGVDEKGLVFAYFVYFSEHSVALDHPEKCVRPAVWDAIQSWAQSVRQKYGGGAAISTSPSRDLDVTAFERDEPALADWTDQRLAEEAD